MESYISDVVCKYMITTNGILIDEEIVDFFEKYKFNVTISIDGDEEQHNFFRKYSTGKGSYKDIIRKINLFKNKKQINARITVASNNTDIRRAIHSILNLELNE